MKIDISKIDEGRFTVREKLDQEHVNHIAESLLENGQWNPIIVRPKEGGRYELIAGHYRFQASKEIGLNEIEATVRDVSDEEADLLSLKTNLLRLDMTAREQGRVISNLMKKYGWTQTEVAERLGKSVSWVGSMLRVALELHEKVAEALDQGLVNYGVASIIGSVEISKQPAFLDVILERGITQPSEASKMKGQFLNTTIFTIGYQGREFSDFVDILENNGIQLVIDARYSPESQYKPEFNGTVLQRELERHNIEYKHIPELGVPFSVQNPYKEGFLSYDCLKQWYTWNTRENIDFEGLIREIKDSGKTVLMCMERYAKPMRNQEYACHRDILADFILKYESDDPLLKFDERIDL